MCRKIIELKSSRISGVKLSFPVRFQLLIPTRTASDFRNPNLNESDPIITDFDAAKNYTLHFNAPRRRYEIIPLCFA